MKYPIGLAVAAGLLVSACGGGGGGGADGSGSGDKTLEVSVSFPQQTLSLFQPAQVQPALSGFEGHTPACTLVSGQIPPGMQLNGNCTIAGTPTVQGSYAFTARVSAAGVSNTLDFTGSIGAQGPGIQYQPASGIVGSAVSSAPGLSWWPAPVAGASWNYSVVSGTLAPGLAVDPASGVISGTLAAQGSFTAQIGATLTTPLGVYQTASTAYSVDVDVPTFSYPPLALTNASGDSLLFLGLPAALQPRTDSSNTMGNFALVRGALPPGLALDSATGLVAGVPNRVSPATDFEVEATITKAGVGTRARASASYEIRVPGRVLYPDSNSVRADATFNTITPLWASNPAMLVPPPPVTATFAPKPGNCTLPAGVTSSATGAIDGHPTQAGAFQCTFTVTYTANGAQWTGEAVLNLDVQ
ncbi:hypothetical protein GCM10028796_49910 [Ramlibacter monticola]|uniref:Ig domain-containing protein n=1 Tax=Ramlibacter monticola TaxID=1926872 RepID=A0A937CS84_9BURK|nr:putative Ig domain-containing protein [Ramlibacter monticola]MBL0390841.1 putative Ig domain-containing protein [Ramlibacter monticola]